jgi:Ran GTPase-activating protein (RanGAP) involved in mRNA processing and transport
MRALLVLNLASNNLFAEGIELLAEALKGNKIMTELNVSDNAATWDGKKHREMSGVIALADAIPDMRALLVLSLKSNDLRTDGGKALAEGLKGNNVITELDISSNQLCLDSNYEPDMSGVVALANAVPGMGALTKIDLSRNNIPSDQEGRLQRICEAGGTELAI